ncbi:hypothetical protein SARC_12013 [Sphaeroforma arctica JP610]|uniref:Glycosyltransferase family 8 protein n=1 Tax=Sphaeroforma arctica JP610 TaxID=667725 RepID=A0A0L0FFA6_9EUKA|nr:hypothetical protein SARC_12013 [Sphaeroforma arctica JP610]KNC75462.1 hypothetical protein SARC_12013 [Sphaeroforma arctica JP610]|eukprot:XP_014149364.1 hypothetical protein SARC_12013 [Sphaeroforma arctica JP610]
MYPPPTPGRTPKFKLKFSFNLKLNLNGNCPYTHFPFVLSHPLCAQVDEITSLLRCHGLDAVADTSADAHEDDSEHWITVVGFNTDIVQDMYKVYTAQNKVGNLASALNYARFYLADLLPGSVRRVIYLDVDIVVQGNLFELEQFTSNAFQEDDEMVIMAAPRQPSGMSKACHTVYREHTGKDFDERHMVQYNAGVFVVDLQRWKEFEMTKDAEFWMAATKKTKLWDYGSQPVMWMTSMGHTGKMDKKWNVDGLGWAKISQNIIITAGVLHWSGKSKPWQKGNRYRQHWLPYRPTNVCVNDVLPADHPLRNGYRGKPPAKEAVPDLGVPAVANALGDEENAEHDSKQQEEDDELMKELRNEQVAQNEVIENVGANQNAGNDAVANENAENEKRVANENARDLLEEQREQERAQDAVGVDVDLEGNQRQGQEGQGDNNPRDVVPQGEDEEDIEEARDQEGHEMGGLAGDAEAENAGDDEEDNEEDNMVANAGDDDEDIEEKNMVANAGDDEEDIEEADGEALDDDALKEAIANGVLYKNLIGNAKGVDLDIEEVDEEEIEDIPEEIEDIPEEEDEDDIEIAPGDEFGEEIGNGEGAAKLGHGDNVKAAEAIRQLQALAAQQQDVMEDAVDKAVKDFEKTNPNADQNIKPKTDPDIDSDANVKADFAFDAKAGANGDAEAADEGDEGIEEIGAENGNKINIDDDDNGIVFEMKNENEVEIPDGDDEDLDGELPADERRRRKVARSATKRTNNIQPPTVSAKNQRDIPERGVDHNGAFRPDMLLDEDAIDAEIMRNLNPRHAPVAMPKGLSVPSIGQLGQSAEDITDSAKDYEAAMRNRAEAMIRALTLIERLNAENALYDPEVLNSDERRGMNMEYEAFAWGRERVREVDEDVTEGDEGGTGDSAEEQAVVESVDNEPGSDAEVFTDESQEYGGVWYSEEEEKVVWREKGRRNMEQLRAGTFEGYYVNGGFGDGRASELSEGDVPFDLEWEEREDVRREVEAQTRLEEQKELERERWRLMRESARKDSKVQSGVGKKLVVDAVL